MVINIQFLNYKTSFYSDKKSGVIGKVTKNGWKKKEFMRIFQKVP